MVVPYVAGVIKLNELARSDNPASLRFLGERNERLACYIVGNPFSISVPVV